MQVCGTRAGAEDYAGEGGDLKGLDYAQLDVADPTAIERFEPLGAALDVLVLSQGIVRYKRAEFRMRGFRDVLEVNLMSVMACAEHLHARLAASKGSLIIVSSSAAFHATKGNPAYNRRAHAPWRRPGRARASGSTASHRASSPPI